MAARRVVKSRAQRFVRDNYKLREWAKKMPAGQRAEYFALIEALREKLTIITKGTEPSDEQIMVGLTWGLEQDDTLTDHVAATRATDLTDEKEWSNITMAAAGAVLQEFVNAAEKEAGS